MKRISKFSAIAGAIAAGVGLAPTSRSVAQAGPIINVLTQACYGADFTGRRSSYSVYGYGPYGYGTSRGYAYPSVYETNDRATSQEYEDRSDDRNGDRNGDRYGDRNGDRRGDRRGELRSYGRAYGRGDPYTGTPGTLYYGHASREPEYNPYGYSGDRSWGGSPNFGHAYSPFGYGTYSAYGY